MINYTGKILLIKLCMHTTVQNTIQQIIHHFSFFLVVTPVYLSIYYYLQSTVKNFPIPSTFRIGKLLCKRHIKSRIKTVKKLTYRINVSMIRKQTSFTQLENGDRVLVRNLTPRGGPGKLRSHWEEEVYVVVDQKGSNPVYTVVPEGHKGKSRVLHRNLLLPCPYLPLNLPQEPANLYPPEPATHHSPDSATSDSSHSDNSDDDEPHQTIPQRTPRKRRPPLQMHYGVAGNPGYVQPQINCT